VKADTVKELDRQGWLKRNFMKPPIKDSVTVPVGGYSVLRFIADNPGVWLFHCHLEFHSTIGMSVMFKVGTQSDLPKPPANWPKCGSFNFDAMSQSVQLSNSWRIKMNVLIINLAALINYIF
jgi:hypothetical protein